MAAVQGLINFSLTGSLKNPTSDIVQADSQNSQQLATSTQPISTIDSPTQGKDSINGGIELARVAGEPF